MPGERIGDWMCTASGLRFWPCDPRPEDIRIEDIAHALANENRFGGHLPEPYSVAQHCVLASWIVKTHLRGSIEEQRWALLHDAAEAYVKDIPRPLKRALGGVYREIEAKVTAAIMLRFDLGPQSPLVKRADELALSMERRDLFPNSHQQVWTLGGADKELPQSRISFLEWRDAKDAFLMQFARLFGQREASNG